jgi:hypothetical protein
MPYNRKETKKSTPLGCATTERKQKESTPSRCVVTKRRNKKKVMAKKKREI